MRGKQEMQRNNGDQNPSSPSASQANAVTVLCGAAGHRRERLSNFGKFSDARAPVATNGSQMSRKFSESKEEELLLSRKETHDRVPLKDVVADCEKRWFEATLKAAKTGDATMQCLVGQMFCSGYGVASDIKKGKYWLQRSTIVDEDACKSLANLSVGEAIDVAIIDSKARLPDREGLILKKGGACPPSRPHDKGTTRTIHAKPPTPPPPHIHNVSTED